MVRLPTIDPKAAANAATMPVALPPPGVGASDANAAA
jgi:hypothetical protein